MKVYIVTESRTATDLFDREDDYTKILGVFAKRGYEDYGAAYLIDIRIDEITAEWADMETYETEVSRPHGEDGDAEIEVRDEDGNVVFEIELHIMEKEVQGA